jgi:hypothetical protein
MDRHAQNNMSNENIKVQPPSAIPNCGRGRNLGHSKYPFSSLTIANNGVGNSFEVESKTGFNLYMCGKRAVPGAKFAIRKLRGADGANRIGPNGNPVFGVWRVK